MQTESIQPGKLIVITGPSGVGKGTLLQALRSQHPELHLSISATTRSPRPSEVEGRDYCFKVREQFEQKRGQDSEAAIARRLKRAQAEIAAADEFQLQIVNDDLETTLKVLESALFANSDLKS